MRIATAMTLCLAVASLTHADTPLILNEYSAVGSTKMLDDEGFDTHFGRVTGNGGDWFELVITANKPDLTGYTFEWAELGEGKKGSFTLTDDPFWKSLPRGTILTFTEDNKASGGLDSDTTFDPARNDWWVNAHLGDKRLIKPGGETISIGNDDWVVTIKDRNGKVVFGPVGEGAATWTGDKINSREVAALHEDPAVTITPASKYNGSTRSTCGSPNTWVNQDGQVQTQHLAPLRVAAITPKEKTDTAVKAAGGGGGVITMETLATIDTPGLSQEIVAYCASQKLLLVTNPFWKTVDVFHVRSLDPPVLEPLPDTDEELEGVQGLWMPGEPTSVAVHPTEPIAFITTLSRDPSVPGRVRGIDLRPETFGHYVVEQAAGMHPDSVSVSPDGRWLVIANEGEGDPNRPGSIGVLDLRGVTADTRARDGARPYIEVPGLDKLLETPLGQIEPEYVAFDPQSRFVAVSCQENDAVALVSLTGETPALMGAIWLPDGSEPDGVSVMDGVPGPEGRPGCLIATANEGRFDPYRVKWLGQSVSFTWIDPANVKPHTLPDVTLPVEPMISGREINRRRDPEGMKLVRFADRVLALVGIERGDHLLCIDATDYKHPALLAKVKVGDRPEGIITIPHGEDLIVVTGDEGDDDDLGPGTISFARLRLTHPAAGAK